MGKAVVVVALLILLLSVLGALLILVLVQDRPLLRSQAHAHKHKPSGERHQGHLLGRQSRRFHIDDVGVRLRNYINRQKFLRVPPNERFIFMPQCVRSTECPAKLTPEGIKCVDCGRCKVGDAKKYAEGLGYRFFIVPGSSFIKRIMKKYRPKAIVGVGCQMEIKEGLDLCYSYDIPALGVPLTQSGCVSTTLDWEKFYDKLADKE